MRELLDTPLDEISEDRLRAVLAAAGDEDVAACATYPGGEAYASQRSAQA